MSGTAVSGTATPPHHASIGRIPPTWMQAVILSRYQFRDYLRSRRFILMMAIVAAAGIILTAVVAYFRPSSLIDNSDDLYGGLGRGARPS
jgi:hypothetical protein